MVEQEQFLDLTKHKEPLSLSDISRALGLSRNVAQKWHNPAVQKATGRAGTPVLRVVAEAMGFELDEELVGGARPRYPVAVVLALGKALGYLDERGQIVEEVRSKGRGKWLPAAPTIDPATKKKRVYVNHLAKKLGVNNETIEMALSRESKKVLPPDGNDEIGRVFWWVPTANKILKKENRTERF
ncbi:hypothetical protein ACH4PU_31125 [Streptomyces sp. NPDC021100]|uniref:hypothetical protein n=1 Tax=Streptomyces sp. NPDC021100 TaxID=3365114 RepID=UPI0037B50E3D